MTLVTPQDIMKSNPIFDFPGGRYLASLFFRFMKLDKINTFYDQYHELPSDEFLNAAIDKLGFHYHLQPDEYQKIPQNGPFITISNHSYGAIDGMILLKILTSIRPDYKILMNFLLAKIKPVEDFVLKVNPFERLPNVQSSYGGLKEALTHLKDGHPIGIFPAGEVASFQFSTGTVTEKKWSYSVIKLISRARVPIIPIYFNGHNSISFHLLGIIHPLLRTAALPSEIFNKSGKEIHVRIGSPVSVRDQDKFVDINEFGQYLRLRTFSLGIPNDKQKRIWSFSSNNPQPVVQSVQSDLIREEIEKLKIDSVLFSQNEYFVFCSHSYKIPHILRELGRLREITYREVGEGTNKDIDLDDFDKYYNHLFLWNDIENKIIGGYRVGFGNKIIESHGIEGFYTNTLFQIKSGFAPFLKLSLELGRSFIIKSHQKRHLSLFLLWKGILHLLIKNPEFRYLIGPVSISNQYCQISKALTVEFLKKNNFNNEFAAFFTARNNFIPAINSVIKENGIRKVTTNNLNVLEKFIKTFDPSFETPVLIKKYLSLNSEVVGFNVDPHFNNCIDVLLITDILSIPREIIKTLSKDLNEMAITKRFEFAKVCV